MAGQKPVEQGADVVAQHVVADPPRSAKIILVIYFTVSMLLLIVIGLAQLSLDKRVSRIELLLEMSYPPKYPFTPEKSRLLDKLEWKVQVIEDDVRELLEFKNSHDKGGK